MNAEALRELSRKGRPIAVCFASGSLYADIGTFSSINQEATEAHIRATIDKTGLFHEEYALSFCKLYDIDAVKAQYSYLALPVRDLKPGEALDARETRLAVFCPVEASVAACVGQADREMAITVFEDARCVRIIASKAGIIYYLTSIDINDSFDLTADTLARLTEVAALLKSSYNENASTIYHMGQGTIDADELALQGMSVTPWENEQDQAGPPELLGTLMGPAYDFTPQTFRQVRRLMTWARCSLGVSALMVIMSVILLGLGLGNSHIAERYESLTRQVMTEYTKNLAELETEYSALCENIDCSSINSLFALYRDFEREPKLHTILSTVTQPVPERLYLARVEVQRPTLATPSARMLSPEVGSVPVIHTDVLDVAIEGTIYAPYPESKAIFSSYVEALQPVYAVQGALFNHLNHHATFSVTCEARP